MQILGNRTVYKLKPGLEVSETLGHNVQPRLSWASPVCCHVSETLLHNSAPSRSLPIPEGRR